MGKIIFGKDVNITLEEIVKIEDSALIIIDMQNDFCSTGGHYERCGRNIDPIKGIVPNLTRLIANARMRGVLIIYIQHTQLPNAVYLSPAVIAHKLKRLGDESRLDYTLEGTWGHQIIDSIKPQQKELIVKKHRASAFVGTDLDLILRSLGKKTIIVTGVITEGCVESTARDGWLRDYYVVVVEDCIASNVPDLHDAQLKIMKYIYHSVIPSKELLKVWQEDHLANVVT